jgi:hypothetical protein
MSPDRNEILNLALGLPEADRFAIAARLLESVPEAVSDESEDSANDLGFDDPEFLAELDRRMLDTDNHVPLSELWKQE